MRKITITKLIGYGILVFVVGALSYYWIPLLKILIPTGSLITLIGIFYYFKKTDMTEAFRKKKGVDLLTYFWDVIVFKFWTFVIVTWMIALNITLFM